MARWKILQPHYIRTVEANKWEYQETDRNTGRPIRTQFDVPRYINPLDPADWTNRWGNKDNAEGEVILCLPGKGLKGDIEFLGDPTPDMIPQDDEAIEISASYADRWKYRVDVGSDATFSQSLVDKFQIEMSAVQSKPAEPVQIKGLEELVAAIAEQSKLLTQNLKRV